MDKINSPSRPVVSQTQKVALVLVRYSSRPENDKAKDAKNAETKDVKSPLLQDVPITMTKLQVSVRPDIYSESLLRTLNILRFA